MPLICLSTCYGGDLLLERPFPLFFDDLLVSEESLVLETMERGLPSNFDKVLKMCLCYCFAFKFKSYEEALIIC